MDRIGIALIIAIIGLGSNALSEDLSWKEMAEMSRPVAGYMAGVSEGKLVVAGGSYWQNKQKHWTATVQIFDPAANAWRDGPSLPAPRSDAACASLGDDLYIFGGGTGSDARRDALVLHAGKWTAVPPASLPESRVYATAVSFGPDIYVLGGIAKAGDYTSVTNTFWRWNSKSKIWTILPALPGPGRINHAMAVIDNMIYVFAGATTGGSDVANLKDVYKYDLVNATWARLPDLSVANRAWWAVGLGDHALLLGGYTDDFASTVYLYDHAGTIRAVANLPHALADAKFFRIGDAVIGSGGEAGPGIRGRWTLEAKLPRSWLTHKNR